MSFRDARITVTFPPAAPGQACAPGVWHVAGSDIRFRSLGDAERFLADQECPAGGPHEWAEQDSGDAYGLIGGAPGTHVVRWVACDNCGAPRPDDER